MPADEIVMGCETKAEKARIVAEYCDPLGKHPIKYLLLMGATDTGEGEVISEPWFRGEDPQLLETDIGGDWLGTLQKINAGDWIDYNRWSDTVDEDAQFRGATVRSPLLMRLLKARRDKKRRGAADEK